MFIWEVTLSFLYGNLTVDVTMNDVETDEESESAAEREAVSRAVAEFPGARNINVLDVELIDAPEDDLDEDGVDEYIPYTSLTGEQARAPYRPMSAQPAPVRDQYRPLASTTRPVALVERQPNGYVPLRHRPVVR